MKRRLAATFLSLSLALQAQTERGNITGVVSDPSGAAIAGALVTITNRATNSGATLPTTTAGAYNAPNLSPGDYRIEISAAGFKRFVQDSVTLTAAGAVRVDAQIQVGQVSETVEVSASAAQIQTETAKTSTAVQNKMVDELPLVVGGALRSVFNLVTITPEARSGGSNKLSIGGGQAAAWNATLDGIAVTTNRSADAAEAALNTPSVDSMTEFTIDTNGFKAEFGQAGGGVMTFVSKSGTNRLHGAAYDFLRNDKLDARGFFPLTKSVYKQNDFGVTLGGPVYLPKLYNGRNRTFFFIAYEGFRNRVGANDRILSVPTPEMFNGDFSKWVDNSGKLLTIYDPATRRANPNGSGFIRDAFPNNQIPLERFSAFTKLVMPYGAVLKPNRPTAVPGTSGWVRNNYISNSGTQLTPTDKGSFKIDQILKQKHSFGFLYNRTAFRNEIGANGPPGFPVPLWDGQVQAFDTSTYRFSYDWTISPRLLNHLSVGGNKFIKNSFTPSSGQNWKSKLCMKGAVDCDVAFPRIAFSEFSQWSGTTYNGTEQPQWSLKDDLSYIHGAHTLKFGYAFQSQRANGFGEQDIMGSATFSFLGTSVPGATSFTSGSSFASFLLGDANQGRTETVRYVPQRFDYHGFYAQDDWRITRKLVLNLGLRYEFTQPPVSDTDIYSDFTPNKPNPAVNNYPGALRFAGSGPGRENTRTLVPGWYGGVGPRIGLAYTPDNKTTFRTAFGRSFSRVTVVSGSNHFAGFIGQYVFTSPDQGVTPAFNWDVGYPAYPLPPLIDPAFSNNNTVDFWNYKDANRAPEDLFWTFSIQRQVTANTVLEIAYNATAGAHLQTGLLNMNQVPTRYWDELVARYGAAQAVNLLRADISSAQARAAGIPIPYPNFTDPKVQQNNRSVAQALRPFPQYLDIRTGDQGGDKSGHSSYHALVVKAERRFSAGLTFQWNYTLSKVITDSDSYYADGGAAMDQYNRRLEKSIGQYDQTHNLKMSSLYELPLGRGKKWLSGGWTSHLLGGWRIAAIQTYASGFPIGLTRNNPLPLFNGATRPQIGSYDNWRAPVKAGKFDPNVDQFLDPAKFPASAQPVGFGNATRYNPKVRAFPNFNENVSLAKSFYFTEQKRLDFRWEAFNLFNRTVFGTGSTNINSNTFGIVTTQVNDPRQMQVALKLYW